LLANNACLLSNVSPGPCFLAGHRVQRANASADDCLMPMLHCFLQVGAQFNDAHQAHEGLLPSLFPADIPTFTGHYHKPQRVPHSKITYVGSPYEGQDNGYGIAFMQAAKVNKNRLSLTMCCKPYIQDAITSVNSIVITDCLPAATYC